MSSVWVLSIRIRLKHTSKLYLVTLGQSRVNWCISRYLQVFILPRDIAFLTKPYRVYNRFKWIRIRLKFISELLSGDYIRVTVNAFRVYPGFVKAWLTVFASSVLLRTVSRAHEGEALISGYHLMFKFSCLLRKCFHFVNVYNIGLYVLWNNFVVRGSVWPILSF